MELVTNPPRKVGNARPNFTWTELECKCGCGTSHIDNEALDALQQLRDMLGVPLRINSAARCPTHNKRIGGKTHSKHISYTADWGLVESTAFDISLDSIDREYLVSKAKECGFNGIGRYTNFVHVDIRTVPAEWTDD